jgi:hypothetical protein
MKNIAKAERPKSATAILPPRPLRESGKAAQTAFKPARRDGNSFIHMVNHFSGNLGIPKLAAATTFKFGNTETVKRAGDFMVCYLAKLTKPFPPWRRKGCALHWVMDKGW